MTDDQQEHPQSENENSDINVGNIEKSQAVAVGHGATAIIGVPIEDIEHLPPEAGKSPYKDLHFYNENDADWFFGRERIIASLVNRLHETNFLAIVGDSGSGKSSVVQAGVVPAMKRKKALVDGSVPPLGKWQVKVMTPTSRPLEKLVDTLFPKDNKLQSEIYSRLETDANAIHKSLAEQLTTENPLLLVIDQFEELFSQCKDEGQREAFIDNVVMAAQSACKIILTLRADFYAPCLRYEQLRQILKENQEPLGPMSHDELRAAILQPAAKGNWRFQQGLVEEILEDVGQEPGALPLLSHALSETWIERRGRVLTLSGYRKKGGVRGAIAQTAERTYQSLSVEGKKIARNIFLRLTELGEGTQDTRRRATLDELLPEDDSRAIFEEVLRLLTTEVRLLTTSQDGVEVAHEALIREWPTLKGWLNEDRDSLRLHRQLTEATEAWQAHEQDESYLFRGGRLAQIYDLTGIDKIDLNLQEIDFLKASQKYEKDELAEAKVRAQRLRAALILAAMLTFVVLILFSDANRSANEARNAEATTQVEYVARTTAEVDALVNGSLAETRASDAQISEINAVESANIANTRQAEAVAAEATAVASQEESERQRQIALAQSIAALSRIVFEQSDDSELATLLAIEGARINWRMAGTVNWLIDDTLRSYLDREIFFNNTLTGYESTIYSVAFSPNGQILASGSGNTVWLQDLSRPEVAPMILRGHEEKVFSLAFSPDGQTLASGSGDNTVRLWDLRQPEAEPMILEGHESSVYSVAFSSDGQTLASGSGDKTVRLWDLSQPEAEPMILEGYESGVNSVAFSPDGQILASSSGDAVWLWDLSQQEAEPIRFWMVESRVHSVAFSPDGETLATGGGGYDGQDYAIRLWRLSQPEEEPMVLQGHEGIVWEVAFSPDGQTLASVSDDFTVLLWNLSQPEPEPVVLQRHEFVVWSVAFSPDGKVLASGSEDETVRLWDLGQPEAEPVVLRGHELSIHSIAFSPDSRILASGSDDSTIRLWDLSHPDAEPRILRGNGGDVRSVTFSPDGHILASGSDDSTVRLWNVRQPELEPIILPGHEYIVESVAFSLDGRTLASGGYDGTVRLWDMSQPEAEPRILNGHENSVNSVVFSPDGQMLVSGSGEAVWLWDLSQPEAEPIILRGYEGRVSSVAFSPDGQMLAIGKGEVILLWDLSQLEAEPVVLRGAESSAFSIAFKPSVSSLGFSPDGQMLVSGGSSGALHLWDLNQLEAEPIVLRGHECCVSSVAFSPDGQVVASGSGDRTIRLWPLLGELVEIGCEKVLRNLSWDEWQQYLPGEPYRQTCPNLPPHPSVPAEVLQ